ncbi:gliding motility-associated C-terminal domain-containing protein [Sinomicrobium sp. M5D2P9]
MTTIKIISVLTVLHVASYVCGQTVNTGALTIAPDTQVSTLGDFDNRAGGDMINDGEFFVYGHFKNDGLLSFSPGQATGLVRFEGMYGAQDISGEGLSEFFGVRFDNPATQPAFRLSGDITVNGNAQFVDGIVYNRSGGGLVDFGPEASHEQVSDRSFVDGQVRKTGDAPFDYPVGNGGYYRGASASGLSDIEGYFTSNYTLENSDARHSHFNKEERIVFIDNEEYWEINRTGGTSDMVLSLTWHEETTPAELLSEEDGKAIHIVRWDGAKGLWVDEGGVENHEEQMVTTAVSGYGIFTLAKVLDEEKPDNSLEVYNGISPNGDGKNDFFYLKGIEHYPDNTVEVYNRWGVLVYEAKGYNNTDVRFNGYSRGRATINKGKLLPTGTYFYILKYKSEDGRAKDRSGYLYIN